MAPELKKRTRSASAASAKPAATKPKAAPAATKRKAAEQDASPVQKKKTKPSKESLPAKPKSKPAKPKSKSKPEPEPESETEAADADEQALVLADENPFSDESDDDQAKALAAAVDSDNEDEEAPDAAVVYKKGQDVGKAPKASKASKTSSGDTGVVYVGRIPHGFFEHEMKQYFSQFGQIERLRLSRNKKTGRSKHFAFIEFAERAVAEIVQKTMDNYLLFGHILKCKMVPREAVHDDLWKGANRRFKGVPRNRLEAGALKKPLTESAWQGKIGREQRRRSARAQKLAAAGIDYDFGGPALLAAAAEPASIEAAEAPKAIEAPPAQAEDKPAAAEDKPAAAKAAKKGKKGKKAKA